MKFLKNSKKKITTDFNIRSKSKTYKLKEGNDNSDNLVKIAFNLD